MKRLGLVAVVLAVGCGGPDGGTIDGGGSADAVVLDAPVADAPGGDDGGGGGPDAATPAGAYFPAGAWMYQDISAAAVHPDSDAITQWLEDNGSWGSGLMRIDFSIEVLQAAADTPDLTFIPTGDFYSPDCDEVPMPVPAGGALEGEEGYDCASDGDCHLIVVDRRVDRLFEMWRANLMGGTFYGGCLAAWDMTRVYPPEGRGEQCTSADAAGFPIAPLLLTAGEVAAAAAGEQEIDHAIRFILPNERMRAGLYTRPGTHAGGPASTSPSAPVYGSRWRLKADFDMGRLPSEAARAVARGLQRHGMALADGGTIALTFQSDRFTTEKWAGLLGSYDLDAILPTDFEVLDTGPNIALTYDCARTPY